VLGEVKTLAADSSAPTASGKPGRSEVEMVSFRVAMALSRISSLEEPGNIYFCGKKAH
jgi:hypothetical protein